MQEVVSMALDAGKPTDRRYSSGSSNWWLLSTRDCMRKGEKVLTRARRLAIVIR